MGVRIQPGLSTSIACLPTLATTISLLRQDLVYWALYVCLRPDRNWRLVLELYYTEYAGPGDSALVRHIDMNVPSYLNSGHGIAII